MPLRGTTPSQYGRHTWGGPNEAFYAKRIGNYERWQWEQFKGILSRTHNEKRVSGAV